MLEVDKQRFFCFFAVVIKSLEFILHAHRETYRHTDTDIDTHIEALQSGDAWGNSCGAVRTLLEPNWKMGRCFLCFWGCLLSFLSPAKSSCLIKNILPWDHKDTSERVLSSPSPFSMQYISPRIRNFLKTFSPFTFRLLSGWIVSYANNIASVDLLSDRK